MSLDQSDNHSVGSSSSTFQDPPLRPPGHDGRTVRVVSGRGYRYVLPFPYKLQ